MSMEFLRRIAAWLGARRRADDLFDEMEAHRAFAQDELERAGLPPAAAEAESRRRMGNVTLAGEDSREVWIVRWVDGIRRHVRYGARGLLREPTFAATAILTLALGTTAATSVFSIVDAEMWRRLPYPEAGRLIVVQSLGPAPLRAVDAISIAEFIAWRRALPALSSLASVGDIRRRAVRHDFTESMRTSEVTANYFTTLGRRAIAGRVFDDTDARGSNAAVLGARGWERAFKRDPGVIGRTIFVDDAPRVIVGVVAADDTAGGTESELFLPIDETASTGTTNLYAGIGRLATGATPDAVREQTQRALDERGRVDPLRTGHTAFVEDLNEYFKRSDGRPLYFFLGAALFVLALTIVNLAALVLARAVRRAPEFALRGALGGGTRAIAAQLGIEAALIALPGAALGFWITRGLMRTLGSIVPEELLWRGTDVAVDYRAAALVAVIVLVTLAGLALAPLGAARRADASVAMASGQRASGLPSASRLRERLLIAQIALTVVLLAGGALFLKSYVALTQVPLGFDVTDGWSMRVTLSGDRYREPARLRAYADTLLGHAKAIPGVRDAAIATTTPLRSGRLVLASDPGAPADGTAAVTRTIYRAVSPDYFRAIGTPLTRGRGFLETDVDGSPLVAVVNEEFVRQYFHGGDPIGRQVAIKGSHAPVPRSVITIVGVAGDVKEVALNEVAFADVYVPFAQRPTTDVELVVRGNGADEAMADVLRAVAYRTDAAVPVSAISAIDRRVAMALQEDRFHLTLAAGFAVLALIVAAIGIYGAMAYAATSKSREFGVRLALGAAPRALLGRALWQAARLGVVGGVIGIAIALGCAAWAGDALYLVPGSHNGLLFQVRTTDPVALGGAAGAIILVALLAGFIPARRLASTDPAKALRGD